MKRAFAALALTPALAFAAGFIDHVEGTPYRWNTAAPIPYRVDIDDPLDTLSNAQLKDIINRAFNTWEAVAIASSNLDFQIDGTAPDLPANVNGTNYSQYVKLNADGSFANVAPNNAGVYILFDSDGAILRGLLQDPLGTETEDILGIASAGRFDAANERILAGFAIINGVSGLTATSVAYTMTHELGHLMNLSHTQLNREEAFDMVTGNDAVVPLMFPFITGKTVTLNDPGLTFPGLLELDDQFALGFVYPEQVAFNSRGILEGKIVRRMGGEGVRGANVTCRKDGDARESAVSWISDQVYTGKGEYLCANLSTGSYHVEIEPVELAINVFDPDPPFVATEFYSGNDESFDPAVDPRASKTAVSVLEGETSDARSVILNEDGRLTSGVAKKGSIEGAYPDLEYFITVPPQASGLRVELETDSDVDLDLYARCGDEFSLTADVTSDPIFDPDGGSQQAEHAAASDGSDETLSIGGGSSPALRGCTYHILVSDFFEASALTPATFEVKATILGAKARLTAKKSSVDFVPLSGGEVLIASQTLKASGDTFNVKALRFDDAGTDPMADVTGAKLYEDTDDDGRLTSDDTLLAGAPAVDVAERRVRFSGLDVYVSPERASRFFVTYELASEAGFPWAAAALLCGLGLSFFRPLRRRGLWILVAVAALSCTDKEGAGRFEPTLSQPTSIDAEGLGFGEDFVVDIDIIPDSVLDFFD